jgi:ubiquinone/menaquinone biosynthesis C-methylase UbiE
MFNLKRTRVVVAPAIVLIMIGLQASQGRYAAAYPVPQATRVPVTSAPTHSVYEMRAVHDPNGIGKFYMGREIAQIMGTGGIAWLDRPERENEERPEVVIDALHLWQGEVVVDLGAGSGYFAFRIAPKVGRTGKVLAVEIQDEMLETIRRRAKALRVTNVKEVRGTETDPRLPADSVDLVLMVDVYHELAYPLEVMTHVRKALKPGGRVVFVEYRKEDPKVPIKEIHKMSIMQLEKKMDVAGFEHLRTLETLPWQHIVIFEKRERTSRANSSSLKRIEYLDTTVEARYQCCREARYERYQAVIELSN